MTRQPVLVWGGSGFVGRGLVAALSSAGADITILSRGRNNPEYTNQGIQWESYGNDRTDVARKVILNAVRRARLIYCLAGSSGAVASNQDPLASLENNCAWHLELLEACRQAGHCPHVVFTSSRLVYGRPLALPVDENHPLAPQSIYAAHKLTVERYHQIFAALGAITSTICRVSVCYGQDGWTGKKNYGFLNTLIQDAKSGKPLTVFGSGNQIRDYIHVRDLGNVLKLCGESTHVQNEIVNVGSGEGMKIADAVYLIAKATGAPVVNVPWPESYLQVETGDYVSSIAKLSGLTGFRPAMNLETAIIEELATTSV